MIQLYGQFGGQNSNAIVSRGIACALHNKFDVQIYDPEGIYNGLWEDIPTGISPSADIGIFVGYPPHSIPLLVGHPIKIGCFIAESSLIPAEWGAIAASCDLVCVPSQWNAVAFVAAGLSPKKLLVMPHGLHPAYKKQPKQSNIERPNGAVSFLHIAGAQAFRDRKGTQSLIKAFGQLAKETSLARLMLRCGPADPDLIAAIKRTEVADRICLTEELPVEPEAMRAFYRMGWDALVLPSRAEAFGMCALEARAMGLPVILTNASGHKQHSEPWDTVIKHDRDTPIKVNGIPGGVAPTVKVSSIYDAMLEYINNRNSRWLWAQRGANNYFDKNSWGKATSHLVQWLKAHRPKVSRPGIGI